MRSVVLFVKLFVVHKENGKTVNQFQNTEDKKWNKANEKPRSAYTDNTPNKIFLSGGLLVKIKLMNPPLPNEKC